MTDVENEARRRMNEAYGGNIYKPHLHHREINSDIEAMCRLLEEFEAFKQEVSDAVEAYADKDVHAPITFLGRFILPKSKPDPLMEALSEALKPNILPENNRYADRLREALAARGYEIREKAGE